MKIGSDKPKLELKFRCGSNAINPAHTNEYLSEKNFLPTLYIKAIVAIEILIAKILIKFEKSWNSSGWAI